MLVNISTTFHEDIITVFKLQSGRHCSRHSQRLKGITKKIHIQELWFVRSARRLMLVNISMTFHEYILNGFQVTERTRFCH